MSEAVIDALADADGPAFVPWPRDQAASYRERGLWRDVSLSAALAKVVADYPQQIAVIDGDRTSRYEQLSYGELWTRIERTAAGLWKLGLRPGDYAVLHLSNRAEFVIALFALLHVGVVPVMVPLGHGSHEVTTYVTQTGARAYLFALDRVTDRRPLAENLLGNSTVEYAIMAVATPEVPVAPFLRFDELEADPIPLPTVDPGAPALLQLSGGSTATPKLIPRTHNDYLYSIERSIEVCSFGVDTVYLAVLPAAHNFTLSSPGILGALLAGGCVVLSPDPTPRTAFSLIQRHAVTVTAVVPSLLDLWLESATKSSPREKLMSFRLLQVGGAPLPISVAQRVQPQLGARLQQVYGMAEGLVCYTRETDDDETVCRTQGRPMCPHDELRIVDEDDQPVEPGEAGELHTRGPYTIRGYFRAAKHNRHAFTHDGYYRTGDLVRLLPSGHVAVVGRVKDQVNRGGEKIAAPELEAHLLHHPALEQVAVVAMPDTRLGERVCAFVVARDQAPSLPALREFLRARGVAPFKLPEHLYVVEELPLTAVGKIDKRTLRTRAAQLAERSKVR